MQDLWSALNDWISFSSASWDASRQYTTALATAWDPLDRADKLICAPSVLCALRVAAEREKNRRQFVGKAKLEVAKLIFELNKLLRKSLKPGYLLEELDTVIKMWYEHDVCVVIMRPSSYERYTFYTHYRPRKDGTWREFEFVCSDHHKAQEQSIMERGLEGKFNADFVGTKLIWFGVMANEDQEGPLKDFRSNSRYGSLRFSIKLDHLLSLYADQCGVEVAELKFFILGTRRYNREHSHVLLVSYTTIPGWPERQPEGKCNLIRKKQGKWSYYTSREDEIAFDHPELAFVMRNNDEFFDVSGANWTFGNVNHTQFCVKLKRALTLTDPCYYDGTPSNGTPSNLNPATESESQEEAS